MIHPLLRCATPAWGVIVLLACIPAIAADNDASATQVAHKFVTIDGQDVTWARAEAGEPLRISLALVQEPVCAAPRAKPPEPCACRCGLLPDAATDSIEDAALARPACKEAAADSIRRPLLHKRQRHPARDRPDPQHGPHIW